MAGCCDGQELAEEEFWEQVVVEKVRWGQSDEEQVKADLDKSR